MSAAKFAKIAKTKIDLYKLQVFAKMLQKFCKFCKKDLQKFCKNYIFNTFFNCFCLPIFATFLQHFYNNLYKLQKTCKNSIAKIANAPIEIAKI